MELQKNNIQVMLIWISPDVGLLGNEKADEATKEVAYSGLRSHFRIPHADLFADSIAAKDRLFKNYLENATRNKSRMYAVLCQKTLVLQEKP